jgi:hypothetical protein
MVIKEDKPKNISWENDKIFYNKTVIEKIQKNFVKYNEGKGEEKIGESTIFWYWLKSIWCYILIIIQRMHFTFPNHKLDSL